MKTISFFADDNLEQAISRLKDLEKRKTTSDLMRFLILERLDFFCKKCLELRTLSPKEDKQ